MSQTNVAALAGTYSQQCFYSKKLQQDWSFGLYLPPQDSASDTRPTSILYVLHGAKDAFPAYTCHTNLLDELEVRREEGTMPPTCVVFVDGFNSYYIDSPEQPVESAFFDELMPLVEEGLDVDRRHRALIGNSMGGYASLRYVLKYNDLFSFAMLLSPAIWPSVNDMNYPFHAFDAPEGREARWLALHPMKLLENLGEGGLAKTGLFVASGKADPTVPVEMVSDAVQILEKYVRVDFSTGSFGLHNWDFWSSCIGDALDAWSRWLR
ncbi:MAG: alpha/beta hydrolase-fold protein [Peptoniphilaceae bacterium]|nr:alpha/beta hydrolase-fold protein [Peptoniphilaceae bacterium]